MKKLLLFLATVTTTINSLAMQPEPTDVYRMDGHVTGRELVYSADVETFKTFLQNADDIALLRHTFTHLRDKPDHIATRYRLALALNELKNNDNALRAEIKLTLQKYKTAKPRRSCTIL